METEPCSQEFNIRDSDDVRWDHVPKDFDWAKTEPGSWLLPNQPLRDTWNNGRLEEHGDGASPLTTIPPMKRFRLEDSSRIPLAGIFASEGREESQELHISRDSYISRIPNFSHTLQEELAELTSKFSEVPTSKLLPIARRMVTSMNSENVQLVQNVKVKWSSSDGRMHEAPLKTETLTIFPLTYTSDITGR